MRQLVSMYNYHSLSVIKQKQTKEKQPFSFTFPLTFKWDQGHQHYTGMKLWSCNKATTMESWKHPRWSKSAETSVQFLPLSLSSPNTGHYIGPCFHFIWVMKKVRSGIKNTVRGNSKPINCFCTVQSYFCFVFKFKKWLQSGSFQSYS